MQPQITVQTLIDNAEMWWPAEIRREVASQSFADTMIATYPLFRRLLVQSENINQLVDNIRTTNNDNSLPANVMLRHCMLFTDLGWEAIYKWFGDSYEQMFPGGAYTVNEVQRQIPKIIKSRVRIETRYITSAFENDLSEAHLQQIISLVTLLFFGSQLPLEQLSRCNMAVYFQDDGTLFDADCSIKYITVSRQTGGAAAAIGGSVLENTVAIEPIQEHLAQNFPDLNLAYRKSYEFIRNQSLTSDQWIINLDNQRAVALEVSFQETTNSTIERKRTDAQNRQALFPENIASVFVLDGVGTLEHRHNAVQDIIDFSNYVVTARRGQVLLLANWIGNFLT